MFIFDNKYILFVFVYKIIYIVICIHIYIEKIKTNMDIQSRSNCTSPQKHFWDFFGDWTESVFVAIEAMTGLRSDNKIGSNRHPNTLLIH
jgi:hypothetical protein